VKNFQNISIKKLGQSYKPQGPQGRIWFGF